MIDFILANLPVGVTPIDLIDLMFALFFGAIGGLGKELWDYFEFSKRTSFLEIIARTSIGAVGGIAGNELCYLIFADGSMSWLFAIAFGASGGVLLFNMLPNIIETLVGKFLKKAPEEKAVIQEEEKLEEVKG